MIRSLLPLLGLALASMLTACGGGDDDSPAPVPAVTDVVPDTASQSSAGLVTYLTALSAAAADDKESVDLSKFSPVQPDDSEPLPLG